MNNFIKIVVLFCVFTRVSFAQDIKFGKVSKEELKEKIYEKDSTADAVVLYRKVNVRFVYVQSEGFQVKTVIHERRKIYNKKGFKYGTVEESLYHGKSGDESFSELKASTYNLTDGEIEKIKIKKSNTFKEETSKYYNKEKFTMPNLKEGSVIEYRYVITSPFYSSFNEVTLQYDIPIKKQEIKVQIPEYFMFKNTTKGHVDFNIIKGTERGSLSYTNKKRGGSYVTKTKYSTSKIDYAENVSTVKMLNVPALRKEEYVNSMENYRTAIKYELQYIKLPNSPMEDYTSSWGKVIEKIYKRQDFGSQLERSKFFKEDLSQV